MNRLAWLIERNSMWGCEWFCACSKDERWTKDANKAILFPSKESAIEVHGWVFLAREETPPTYPWKTDGASGEWEYTYDITEHMFIDEAPAEQNAAAQEKMPQVGPLTRPEVLSRQLEAVTPVAAAPHDQEALRVEGLQIALGLFAEDTWGATAIRAEIERRRK